MSLFRCAFGFLRRKQTFACVLCVLSFSIGCFFTTQRQDRSCCEQVRLLEKALEIANADLKRIVAERNRLKIENDSHVTRPNTKSTIYAITPTYARLTQKADLTRLAQTLRHVPNFHWILVEDSPSKTSLVTRFLSTSGLTYTHLAIPTASQRKLRPDEPRWKKARGVEQRNLAIEYLVQNEADKGGVVYFADDDNTYDVRIFEEMRETRRVSVWPVGLTGGLRFEGPVCSNGAVTGWHTAWHPERPFPLDMAGFAVNLAELVRNKRARIDPNAARGYLESSLLEPILRKEEAEPLAKDCTEVSWKNT